MFYLVSLFTGLLFGIGMALSGMIDPQLVTAFLDPFGSWNPALLFVMGGALLVFVPGYQLLIKRRNQPVLAKSWGMNKNSVVDYKLIGGAAIFGIGWGLLGVCPGPAVSSVLAGNSDVWLFLAALMAGIAVNKILVRLSQDAQ